MLKGNISYYVTSVTAIRKCIINILTIINLILISKVAVLKNRWLAKRLGGEMFAVVFKYEVPGRQTHCIE